MSQDFAYDQQLDLFEWNYQKFYEHFTNKIIFSPKSVESWLIAYMRQKPNMWKSCKLTCLYSDYFSDFSCYRHGTPSTPGSNGFLSHICPVFRFLQHLLSLAVFVHCDSYYFLLRSYKKINILYNYITVILDKHLIKSHRIRKKTVGELGPYFFSNMFFIFFIIVLFKNCLTCMYFCAKMFVAKLSLYKAMFNNK